MKSKEHLISGYTITESADYINTLYPIPKVVNDQLEELYHLAKKGKKSSLKRLLNLVEKYPNVPILKNYLSVLYNNIGNVKKGEEVNHWIVAEHPDYLYGKINLAAEYWKNKQYQKIPEVLGEGMELKELYPERDTFHIAEVKGFFKMAILYYAAIDDVEQAEIRLDILHELAPDSDEYKIASNQVIVARMKIGHERIMELQKTEISVKTIKTISGNKTEMPQFTHPEIELLYSKGLYIGKRNLDKILSLPRETLIRDLELVLTDSLDRYNYFNELCEEGWDEERMNFLIHAFFLLGEIEATESLDCVLNILRQDGDYYELYFGDFLTSLVWEPLYKIASNQLEACKKFMFEPAIYTYCKTEISKMVEQVALHQYDRRDEAVAWLNDVLSFYLNCKIEDNIIDSDLIGLMICNLLDLDDKESLHIIEKLFAKGYVSVNVTGTYDDVVYAMNEPSSNHKDDILGISHRYTQITSTWAGYKEPEKKIHSEEVLDKVSELINKKSRAGRNDPCPCGSGKKYKKCCLNK